MGFSERIKTIYYKQPRVARLIRVLHNYVSGNIIKGEGSINKSEVIMKKTKITINGINNKIIFDKNIRLFNCSFSVSGDNNTIFIGEGCNLTNCNFWMEDSNNIIKLGAKTTINGDTQIACIEGCKVVIGTDCMFSSDISIRTGDSHSIIDKEGARMNKSKDVTIGNHVWIGTKVIINKGVTISCNSIVGAGAVVTKIFDESNIILAGNPAKKIKSEIEWLRERI